jgi:hypothetical protein
MKTVQVRRGLLLAALEVMRETADELEISHFHHGRKRVEPEEIRQEIERYRNQAKEIEEILK